jgi:hypothetical protein
VGRCLTYIEESIWFVLCFRVGPRTNRLVGDKGLEKKRGQTGCGKARDWAKARDCARWAGLSDARLSMGTTWHEAHGVA